MTVRPSAASVVILRTAFGYDRLCGLAVRVLGYRSRGPGSISALPGFLISNGSGTESTLPCEYNLGDTWKKK
jgi:hypothetical protein